MSKNDRFSTLSNRKQHRIAKNEIEQDNSSISSDELFNQNFRDLPDAQQRKIVEAELQAEEETEHESIQDDMELSQASEQSSVNNLLLADDADPEEYNSRVFDHDSGQYNPMPEESDSVSDFDDDDYIFSDEDVLNNSSDEGDALPNLRDFCMRKLKDDGTNELLKILKTDFHIENLPGTAVELYDTPEEVMPKPVPINGGHYLHLGIRSNLKFIDIPDPILNHLTLSFSWDGVRLFKSSTKCLWPLVMRVEPLEYLDVLLVGLFIGDTKPENPNEFFYCFNRECEVIADNHFEVEVGVNKDRCTVHLGNMIADAVARIWALGT